MTKTNRAPYGLRDDGSAQCINVDPGTYGHECGKPAAWIGVSPTGFRACCCDFHRHHGAEFRNTVQFLPLAI